IVRVAGLAESLAEMTIGSPLEFVRLAWHLGNRHTDVEFAGKTLRVRRDHVLEEMAAGLGAAVTPVEAAFNPEPSPGAHEHAHRHQVEKPAANGAAADKSLPSPALDRLQAWLSPAYPVGAFSFSSGLEWAVEAGDVTDAASLQRWLAVVLSEGGGFCAAV